MDDADVDLAVDGIVWSAFGTAGQRCTAASRVIVQRGVYEELQSKLVARAEAMRIGAAVGGRHRHRPGDQRGRGREDPLVHRDRPGTRARSCSPAASASTGQGFYYRPTVFADVEPQMRIAQEEIFGPTTALIPVDSFDEAVRAANSVRYGLSSSIFTRDVNKAFAAMRDLQTGITYINAGTTGAEVHLPFGGMKQTGNGHREAGQAALDVFTEWKSIYVDYSRQAAARPDRQSSEVKLPATRRQRPRRLGDLPRLLADLRRRPRVTPPAEACVDAAFDARDQLLRHGERLRRRGVRRSSSARCSRSRPRDSYVLATKVFGEMPRRRPRALACADPQADRRLPRAAPHGLRRPLPVPQLRPTTSRSRRHSAALTEVVRAGKARYIGVVELERRADPSRGRARARATASRRSSRRSPSTRCSIDDPERDVFPASAAKRHLADRAGRRSPRVCSRASTRRVQGDRSGTRAAARAATRSCRGT